MHGYTSRKHHPAKNKYNFSWATLRMDGNPMPMDWQNNLHGSDRVLTSYVLNIGSWIHRGKLEGNNMILKSNSKWRGRIQNQNHFLFCFGEVRKWEANGIFPKMLWYFPFRNQIQIGQEDELV